MSKPIHYVDYASQPDIHIICMGDKGWTTPAWGFPEGPEPRVYVADEGEHYTFDLDKTTCPDCKTKATAEKEKA